MSSKPKQSPKLPGTLRQFTAQQQTIPQIGAGTAHRVPKLPGTPSHGPEIRQVGGGSPNPMPQERKQSPKLPGTPVMQTTPVPRNPADRCRNRNQTSETARHARPAHSAAADSLADRCRLRNQTSETARHARPAHDSRRRALESFKACKTPKASKRA